MRPLAPAYPLHVPLFIPSTLFVLALALTVVLAFSPSASTQAEPEVTENPVPLSVAMEVMETPSGDPAARLWSATVVVDCGVPGKCGHTRVDLRSMRPAGGPGTLIPINDDGRPSFASPFVVPLTAPDKEIVVALFETFNELRILQHTPGGFATVLNHKLPTWIEALAFGDVDDDGLKEIVVGLADTFAPQLRVIRYDHPLAALTEEVVSGVLPLHIETLDVGDADNDGTNEIVIGLERLSPGQPGNVSRLRLYKRSGGTWTETLISAPEALSVEDVKIDDPDDDGLNEIVALMANAGAAGPRQVRLYKRAPSGWTVENLTSLVTSGPIGAERLVVGDADGDGDKEIVIPYWGSVTKLVALDRTGIGWEEVIISSNPGMVDGLALGFFDANERPDIITGEGQSLGGSGRVRRFEHDSATGTWQMTFLSPALGGMRDADFGDADNDGSKDVLIANLASLRLFKPQGSSVIANFPTTIDSALAADVDHDEPGNPRVCDLSLTASCTEEFLFLSFRGAPVGTWLVTAHAAPLAGGSTAISEPAVIELIACPEWACEPCVEYCHTSGTCKPSCSDGTCNPECENCANCPQDCGCPACTTICDMGLCRSTCGDAACNPLCENCSSCSADCSCPGCTHRCEAGACVSNCGDGLCDDNCEDCGNCAADCGCADGVDCTDDSCVTGVCTYTPNNANCADDGDKCTDAICDAALGCTHPKNAACGACCDHSEVDGGCADQVPPQDCTGDPQLNHFPDETCAEVEARGDCLEHTGACCDESTFGGCEVLPQSRCACEKCVFYKDVPCEEIACVHNPIPTMSQWGLAVLTLLLLTGAKIHFGRRVLTL